MPGSGTIKFINSLKQKKLRRQHGLFIIEGEKMVDELMKSPFKIHSVYATGQWFIERDLDPEDSNGKGCLHRHHYRLCEIKEHELKRISTLTTPNKVLALVHTPSFTLEPGGLKNSLTLVLDNVQDPGNLGTLIRSADWFGVDTIILSEDSTEVTSPKVVQSTMGSILRVRYHYLDLPSFLQWPEIKVLPVFGTFTGGPSVYSVDLPDRGLIILGNESRGISPEVEKLVTRKISIPPWHMGIRQAESLNIAIAGSIILSEFRRRMHSRE